MVDLLKDRQADSVGRRGRLVAVLSKFHVWNRPKGMDKYVVAVPNKRVLISLWFLTGVIGSFAILVLSIGSPAHGIYPDPKLEGMTLEPGFWVSLFFWALFGASGPLMIAKIGGQNMLLVFILVAIVGVLTYSWYAPFWVAFFIGGPLGAAVEGTLHYRHMHISSRRRGPNP